MIVMPACLATARLGLRAPRTADTAAIFSYAGDPQATRYMVWPTLDDIEQVADLLDDVAWGWSQGDDYGYAVVARGTHDARDDTDTVIGMVSCQFSDDGAEIGFIFQRDHWGQGLAREAVSAVIEAAWQIDDLYRVWASCDPDNTRCTHLLERVGMRYEGCLRRRSARPNLVTRDFGPRDDAIYAMVR